MKRRYKISIQVDGDRGISQSHEGTIAYLFNQLTAIGQKTLQRYFLMMHSDLAVDGITIRSGSVSYTIERTAVYEQQQ